MLVSWLLLCAFAWAGRCADENEDIRSIPLRTHSLHVPYLDSDIQSRWFDFGGDTVIRTDKYVRLTADRGSQTGWIFSRVPLTATNWEIEFEFQIHGKGNLYGDGFALWLTKNRAEMGPVFGSVDRFEGLGVFFDTYKNNRPGTVFPYVSAMLGNGQLPYDAANDGKGTELAGCSARGIRNSGVPTKARITYFMDKDLKLELQYKKEDEWTECFTVQNVKIPSVSYLGFSAHTGDLSDNHDIISIDTRNLYNSGGSSSGPTTQGGSRGSLHSGGSSSGGSWSWFLLKIVLFALACGGGYFGWTVYRAQKWNSRF